MDEDLFKSAVTITDVYRLSQELKEQGYDIATVNALASKRKRELVNEIAQSRRLKRETPTSVAVLRKRYTQFLFEDNNLNEGRIVFSSDKIII